MNVVIIGAGFTAASAAWLMREQLGVDVTILEQSTAAGGMLRTLQTPEGIPYEYGPRVVSVFRGSPDALSFVRRFADLEPRQIYQGTRLRPEYPVIPFPVDLHSLEKLPCGDRIQQELAAIRSEGAPPGEADLRDYLVSTVGPTLTELAFEGFNQKFWGRRLEEMPAEWGKLRRLDQVAERGNYRLPSAAPHYYPSGGFNPMFDKLLEETTVRYGVRVLGIDTRGRDAIAITNRGEFAADLVIATGPIDSMLGYRFGPLEWRGYRIETDVVDAAAGARLGTAPDGIPFSWVYTPWMDNPVARTTDFGVIHHGHDGDRSAPSVVLREIVDDTVRMYPVWWEDERFYQYLGSATEIPKLIPLGRLGLYKYVTIDTTYGMVRRMIEQLDRYLSADSSERFEIMREVRGDWDN